MAEAKKGMRALAVRTALILGLSLLAACAGGDGHAALHDASAACVPGQAGCACLPDGTCNADQPGMDTICDGDAGLCSNVMPEGTRPANPKCYSPCSNDVELSDGGVRTCDHDGLMAGCIGLTECIEGSCLVPEALLTNSGGTAGKGATDDAVSPCKHDNECPEHQACLEGGCYSNCEVDSECPASNVCKKHVCRIKCQTSDAHSCPSGYVCTSADGTQGLCTPSPAASKLTPPPVDNGARFSLSNSAIELSNNLTSTSFTISNDGDGPLLFTVRKIDHVEIHDDGRVKETKNPLFWLSLSEENGKESLGNSIDVAVAAKGKSTIVLNHAGNPKIDQWEGHLEVRPRGAGGQRVLLRYSTTPDGLWVGKIYYLINFDEGGVGALAAWQKNPSSHTLAEHTSNALLTRWSDFITDPGLFSLEAWNALVDSTVHGSWNFPLVKSACLDGQEDTSKLKCYPYLSGKQGEKGVRVYTDSDSLRIPSGVMEMPFAMALKRTHVNQVLSYGGRVQSGRALQYPGDPGVSLEFAADPASCASDGDACLVPIKNFSMTAYSGARFQPGQAGCQDPWFQREEPWLVDSFTQGTILGEHNVRLHRECRDDALPLAATDAFTQRKNASFSGTNPIPDGKRRKRTLELLDGRLINQDTLFMIVRETFDAKLWGSKVEDSFAGYGIMMLKREPADLTADATKPPKEPSAAPPEPASTSSADGSFSCAVLGETIDSSNVESKVQLLLDGRTSETVLSPVTPGDGWAAHYLCHDTGRFDGGPKGGRDAEPCPFDSKVTYFLSTENVGADPCQGTNTCTEGLCDKTPANKGTCAARLAEIQRLRPSTLVLSPLFDCLKEDSSSEPDPTRPYCSENRQDLRAEKVFYHPLEHTSEPSFLSFTKALSDAFRYRTRFVNREGKNIGFMPATCQLGQATPYCYDPAGIEQLRGRVDCLTQIRRKLPLQDATKKTLDAFLVENFAGRDPQDTSNDDSEALQASEERSTVLGFERMYAELLIMLGDDAYTRALGSRFDLAEAAVGTFEGAEFEPGGVSLSGGAGYELRSLYQAKQAYEQVVDRFYLQSGVLWEDVNDKNGPSLVAQSTISNYVGRVVMASTKKAEVASEIAKRYQGFGRADLARHVIERDYARAYLESVVLNELLKQYLAVVHTDEITDLRINMERAQNSYRSALEHMGETYQKLSDELTYFGDPADYLPFPTPMQYDLEPPQLMIQRAQESMLIAKERDDRALQTNRQFDTDAASFQSELRTVELTYENQLADLCGSFQSADGQSYPAIPKYAEDSALVVLGGNPCGLVGNGKLFEARGEVQAAATDLRIAVQAMRDTLQKKDIEEQRINQECNARVKLATLGYEAAGQVITFQAKQQECERKMSEWDRRLALCDRVSKVANAVAVTAQQLSTTAKACSDLGAEFDGDAAACITGGFATYAFGAAAVAETAGLVMQGIANAENASLQQQIQDATQSISSIHATAEAQEALAQCQQCEDWATQFKGMTPPAGKPTDCPSGKWTDGPLVIDSKARVDTLMVDMNQAALNGMQAELKLNLAQGALDSLLHQARRLMAQASEQEQQLINVEAARNDPNMRLLGNADVLDADKAFHDALVDAYRATRVFEYYTAQSYARKGDLFLARLAAHGEYSIENYLLDLQRALHDFENTYGRPELRVLVVSLRDDILRDVRTSPEGEALSINARNDRLRTALTDPSRLDARGYLTFQFAVASDVTSPLTAIHKLQHVEAELVGAHGDGFARVYLTPRGTAAVRGLDGQTSFVRLPAVTAVISAFADGFKPAFVDPEVYRDQRLRDRPLVNSLWELGLNLRDEPVNKDINVSDLSDIRLYFYYEDFTQLD